MVLVRRIVAVDIQAHAIMEMHKDTKDPVARWIIDPAVDTLTRVGLQELVIVGVQAMLGAQAVREICEVLRGDREVAGLVTGECRIAQERK